MGCFSACFRKRRRSRKPTNPTPRTVEFLQSLQFARAIEPADVKEEVNTKALINPNPNSVDDEQNEELGVSGRKKVTFDLKVQFHEKLPATDENDGNEKDEEEEEEEEEGEKEKEGNCSSSSRIPIPNNYRYQNCRESDEDDEFDDELASDEDSDHDYMGDNEEEEEEESQNEVSSDSLVESDESLLSSSVESLNEKLATSNSKITDEIKSFESVLPPVENLLLGKENNMNSMKPNLTDKVTKSKEMMAVDTSLSSWLNTTPKSRDNSVSVGNSPCSGGRSYEDRPILGVLTVEDIRQFSVTSTPRKSPSRSPDDMPIIGSVGTYWRS